MDSCACIYSCDSKQASPKCHVYITMLRVHIEYMYIQIFINFAQHYSLHSFCFIGDSSFASTLTHVRMCKCHGIDVSYSTRVMERSLKQRGMYMHESSLQELLLEFTRKCKRWVLLQLRILDVSHRQGGGAHGPPPFFGLRN